MRIGIVFDLFDDYPWQDGEPPDADAENEPEETVRALEDAVRILGHEPVRLGSPLSLAHHLPGADISLAINIAEGAHSRNREAYAPVILEMAGIPFLGSDAATLSLSLDKAWTKDLATAAGVRTPPYVLARPGTLDAGKLPAAYPLFVKPRYEGSSKGIQASSRVGSFDELYAEVARCELAYKQDALVEPFIDGPEYTVMVIGSKSPRALAPLQRATDPATGIGSHALERRGYRASEVGYALNGEISRQLDGLLMEASLSVFRKLECRDFARLDFRVDGNGDIWFLEINPLPTFAPDGTLAILAELDGTPYEEFLATILNEGIEALHINNVVR